MRLNLKHDKLIMDEIKTSNIQKQFRSDMISSLLHVVFLSKFVL